MAVRGVEIRRIRLRLHRPLRAAHGVEHERRVLLVRVTTDDGEGWGECSPLTRPTYLPDYLAGTELALREVLVPALLTGSTSGDHPLDIVGHAAARAGLDTALLDARLRSDGVSLAAWLGGSGGAVGRGATIGSDSIDAMCAAAAAAVDDGAGRVKVKIAPGLAVEPVREIAAALGGRVPLHVDANGSYSLDEAAELLVLGDLGVSLVEQPLPAGDLVGSARLQDMLGAEVDVCLDESIDSPDAVSTVGAVGAGRVVSVKPARLGGVGAARQTIERAATAGLGVLIGGMWESGLGRHVAVSLASSPLVDRLGDIGPTSDYLADDVVPPIEVSGGRLAVWTGPGCAPVPDSSAVEALTEQIVVRTGEI